MLKFCYMDRKKLIEYIESFGVKVHTTTKARGHYGFFLKDRIDISKNVPECRVVQTLLHEFTHYVHYKIEPTLSKTGGSLEVIFGESSDVIEQELLRVTNFVDKNSLCVRLYEHRDRVRAQIKEYDAVIKQTYPKFMRSKKFKEFDRAIKKSNARYLLKYDRVKLITGFFRKKEELITISTIEENFPELSPAFVAYIRLRSCQKKQQRISARINKLQKYYKKPTELFARLIEGLYMDREWVEALAPYTTGLLYKRFAEGWFPELSGIVNKIIDI